MRIPSKVEYAYKAVLELSSAYHGGKPLQVNTIAEVHGISPKFLLQVMIQLKNAGIITSQRGATGGYFLARRPDQISLNEVIMAVDHGILDDPLDKSRKPGQSEKPLIQVWEEVIAALRKKFIATDFESLRLKSLQEEAFVYRI